MKKIKLYIVLGILISITLLVIEINIYEKGKKNQDNLIKVEKFNVKYGDFLFQSDKLGPKINVYLTKEKKIVEMSIEDYCFGVVAGEMPAAFEIEALKAQAVVARTYAFSHMSIFGGYLCTQGEGANICDSVHCQVYMKKEDRLASWTKNKREEYLNKINQAVESTRAQVLTYNKQLVLHAYYFSTSSGYTENAIDVFNVDEPYLISVESKGEEIAPKYKTTSSISYEAIAVKINEKYPQSDIKAGDIKNQTNILSTTKSGTVKEMKIGSITMSGVSFRKILGLSSSNFTFKFSENNLEITCLGYGHDVGMSQWGANSMAKSGKNYLDILTHYYSGVNIENLKY